MLEIQQFRYLAVRADRRIRLRLSAENHNGRWRRALTDARHDRSVQSPGLDLRRKPSGFSLFLPVVTYRHKLSWHAHCLGLSDVGVAGFPNEELGPVFPAATRENGASLTRR